ncbi:MAG: GNAT family N-acetyltransferase [Defluviitaleaceae bacterium]|nr:GNAT family N-acetyltransferase [Defluviitaleaceae bacterium]
MSEIVYRQIDQTLKDKIISIHGDWITQHCCLCIEEGSYAVAALLNEEIVGFAGINSAELPPPLNGCFDAFINCIEVDERFQRHGIGRHLIGMLESWAKAYGYRQIRAWSSEDKVAAIHMWYALNYGMCPSIEVHDVIIKGYVYAKILNPA